MVVLSFGVWACVRSLHSCYPWHREGEYSQFMAPGDEVALQWVLEFNKFDLYTKVPAPFLRSPAPVTVTRVHVCAGGQRARCGSTEAVLPVPH